VHRTIRFNRRTPREQRGPTRGINAKSQGHAKAMTAKYAKYTNGKRISHMEAAESTDSSPLNLPQVAGRFCRKPGTGVWHLADLTGGRRENRGGRHEELTQRRKAAQRRKGEGHDREICEIHERKPISHTEAAESTER
jgi:hypothetical protein